MDKTGKVCLKIIKKTFHFQQIVLIRKKQALDISYLNILDDISLAQEDCVDCYESLKINSEILANIRIYES